MGCFVGYGDGVKGFRIYLPSEGGIILSRDVTFDESTMYSKKSSKSSNLGKEGENLLHTVGVLEVHQSSIDDLPRCNLLMMMLRFQCRILLNLRLFHLLLTMGRR